MSSKRIIVLSAPPSINENKVRSHWRGFHTAKKLWQAQIESLLLATGLPRPIPADGPIRVDAALRFSTRHRRDSENYRPVLSKALGDALVNGGWLADDTDADWRLQVTIEPVPGAPTTTITVSWEPAEPVAEAA